MSSHNWLGVIASWFEWIRNRFTVKATSRELRVSEIKQLGDKRFIAVVEVGAERFLIGAAGSSVSLLSTLSPRPFAKVLEKQTRRRSKS